MLRNEFGINVPKARNSIDNPKSLASNHPTQSVPKKLIAFDDYSCSYLLHRRPPDSQVHCRYYTRLTSIRHNHKEVKFREQGRYLLLVTSSSAKHPTLSCIQSSGLVQLIEPAD